MRYFPLLSLCRGPYVLCDANQVALGCLPTCSTLTSTCDWQTLDALEEARRDFWDSEIIMRSIHNINTWNSQWTVISELSQVILLVSALLSNCVTILLMMFEGRSAVTLMKVTILSTILFLKLPDGTFMMCLWIASSSAVTMMTMWYGGSFLATYKLGLLLISRSLGLSSCWSSLLKI